MNYEQKHKNALERARDLMTNQNPPAFDKHLIEMIFPELAKSEDERIREALIKILNKIVINTNYKELGIDYNIRDMIAWLEKQGEKKKVSIWKHWKNGIAGHVDGKQTYLIKNGTTYSLSSCLGFECDYIELSELDNLMLEKQCEKDPCTNCINDKGCITCENGNMKEIEVTHKFKVGDWIVFNGLILHIDEVVNGYYRTTSRGDGIHNSYDWDIDNAARLWTIAEAKAGDVLYLQHEGMEHVIIYKRLIKKNFHSILSVHCAYDSSTNDFFEDVDSYHCVTSECDEKGIHPATKEQRNLLFQKMKDAGYEWDSEKNELKKIKVKTLDVDKVIEWLKPYSVIVDNIIDEFKKDFGL